MSHCKQMLLPLVFISFLVSCQAPTSAASASVSEATSPSTVSSASVVSTSTVTTTPLSKALRHLKKGFRVWTLFRCSYQASSYATTSIADGKEVLLKTADKEYASRALSIDSQGELVDKGSSFTYYGGDKDDLLYQKNLNYKNEPFDNYSLMGKNRFGASFYNPFENLDAENLSETGSGDYDFSEGFGRELVSWFGYSLSEIKDRPVLLSSLHLEGEEITSLDFSYQEDTSRKVPFVCTFHLDFKDTGDGFDYTPLEPLKDDGTDKTALQQAFGSLGSNFCCRYQLTPGEMKLVTGQTWLIYYTGESIYFDLDCYYSVPGLSKGDILMKKAKPEDSELTVYVYSSDKKAFESNSTTAVYADELLDYSGISMAFFTKTASGYQVRSPYESSLFSALEPLEARNVWISSQANGTAVTLDSAGLPTIKETYENDSMGFGENETVTVSFSAKGNCVLPDSVSAATIA